MEHKALHTALHPLPSHLNDVQAGGAGAPHVDHHRVHQRTLGKGLDLDGHGGAAGDQQAQQGQQGSKGGASTERAGWLAKMTLALALRRLVPSG